MKRWLAGVALVVACKGKAKEAAPPPSPSPSAAAAVAVDATPGDAAVAKATLTFDEEGGAELKLAFDKHVPDLPAVSADGAWIAHYDSDAGEPMFPNPVYVAIEPLAGKGKIERLEIVDLDMAAASQEAPNWEDSPPPAATIQKLKERGAAVLKRLDGFASLVKIDGTTDQGEPLPVEIGRAKLVTTENANESITFVLGSKRETIDAYSSSEKPASFDGGSCSYRPLLSQVYRDAATTTAYIEVGFRFNEECTPQPSTWIVWPLPTAEDDEVARLLAAQLDAARDPKLFVDGADTTSLPAGGSHTDSNVVTIMARDGKSAWGSLTTKLGAESYRVSTVFAKPGSAWKIVATTATKPYDNAAANKDAQAGKLKTPAVTPPAGDAALAAAFAKLVSGGVDADAASRDDLVAIGSGPGERTVGGAGFAKAWNAAWKGKAKLIAATAHVAPSGATGWVSAVIELPKKGYAIPFTVFCVFDKTTAGAWSLVHIQFRV